MQTGVVYLPQAEGFLPVLCQGCSRTPKGSHGVVNLKGQPPIADLTEAQNVACADALAAYLLIWYGCSWVPKLSLCCIIAMIAARLMRVSYMLCLMPPIDVVLLAAGKSNTQRAAG